MRLPRFKKWFAALPALNRGQRQRVRGALHPAAGLDQLLALQCRRIYNDLSGAAPGDEAHP